MDAKNLSRKLILFKSEMQKINNELEICDIQGIRFENKRVIDLMMKSAKIQGAIDVLVDLLDGLSK